MNTAISKATFEDKLEAMRGALKIRELDIMICNSKILSTSTGEILEGYNLGIVGPLIACVTKEADYKANQKINFNDKILIPGMIDIHVHFESSHLLPRNYANIVCSQGTSTIFYDPHELANVAGIEGVKFAIEQARDTPLRFICAVPSTVPSAFGLECSGATFFAREIEEIMDSFELNAIAEMMDMQAIINGDKRMIDILSLGHSRDSIIEGHARNLIGKELMAYKCIGIDSDHELTSGDDAINKLRNGMTVEIRGSHDHILRDVCNKIKPYSKSPLLTICTDDVPLDYLVSNGGVIDVARRMISYGLDPIDVITMATRNSAIRLRRRDLGALTPGSIADIVVLNDIGKLDINSVILSGSKLLNAYQQSYTEKFINTINIEHSIPNMFSIKAPDKLTSKIKVINGFRNPYISEVNLCVNSDSEVITPDGCAKIAVQHRHGKVLSNPQIAFIQGIGTINGAIATSYSHDSHNVVVIGSNDIDMSVATNQLKIQGGGFVLAKDGQILSKIELPIYGILSSSDAYSLATEWAIMVSTSNEVTDWIPPYWTFKTIEGTSLACNVGPHLTDLGIFDGKTKQKINIF